MDGSNLPSLPKQDPDAVVRQRAAGTLEYISVKEVGARDLTQHGGVQLLLSLLEDTVGPVRDAAYAALIEAARFNGVRFAIVQTGTSLPRLLQLVLAEEHERSLQGLVLLNACVHVSGVYLGPCILWINLPECLNLCNPSHY